MTPIKKASPAAIYNTPPTKLEDKIDKGGIFYEIKYFCPYYSPPFLFTSKKAAMLLQFRFRQVVNCVVSADFSICPITLILQLPLGSIRWPHF